jgi:hypothetical protein
MRIEPCENIFRKSPPGFTLRATAFFAQFW